MTENETDFLDDLALNALNMKVNVLGGKAEGEITLYEDYHRFLDRLSQAASQAVSDFTGDDPEMAAFEERTLPAVREEIWERLNG